MSKGEDAFEWQIKAAGLPAPEREYRFHDTRRWRFDFAWPALLISAEIEGGVWMGKAGRHTSPQGYIADCEKYNEAQMAGWLVLRFTPQQVNSGYALGILERAIKRAEGGEI